MSPINVEGWIALLREVGLSQEDMTKWHQLFEERYPEDHQSFLEWLGLDADHIRQVRNL